MSTYNTLVNWFRPMGGIQIKTRPFQSLVFQYPLKNPQRLLPLCCPSTCTHHCTRSDMVRSNLWGAIGIMERILLRDGILRKCGYSIPAYSLYMILTLWVYQKNMFCPSALWLLRDIRLPTQMPQYALALGIRWNIISSRNCHCVVLPHALITWKYTQSWNSITKALGLTNMWKENNKSFGTLMAAATGFLLSSRIKAHHIWPQEDLGFRQSFKATDWWYTTSWVSLSGPIHQHLSPGTMAVMLQNTQNISLEGRDATILYNHPRLHKDRVTCCIISKRQRARCHSLDFSQALMVALKLMTSGCTSFADFMYSKAWRDLPSFHPERNVFSCD